MADAVRFPMNRTTFPLPVLAVLALGALLTACTSDDCPAAGDGLATSSSPLPPDTTVSVTNSTPGAVTPPEDIEAAFARQVAAGEALAPTVIGLPRADAEAALNASGQNWRPVQIDDQLLPVTEDWRPGRLNITFTHGRLTKIEVEAGKTFP